jgi:hypothetical protein
MTQDEFQSAMLAFVAEQKDFNKRIDAGVKDLQRFAVEQTEFNIKQMETNKELKISHDGLVKLIEQEVVDRLDVRNEKAMQYTDFRVQDHEERYQHVPVGV